MSEVTESILLISKHEFSRDELADAQLAGFDVMMSRSKAAIPYELHSIRPVAVAVDFAYCQQISLSVAPFIEKLHKPRSAMPIYLFNAPPAEWFDFIAKDQVYAVWSETPTLGTLAGSVRKFLDLKSMQGLDRALRHSVLMPCLLKKLGASGLLSGQIRDISPKGMRVVLDGPCEDWGAGDEIRFSFCKPDGGTTYIDGFGLLRWTAQADQAGASSCSQIGLEFSQLPQSAFQEVMTLLNSSRATAL